MKNFKLIHYNTPGYQEQVRLRYEVLRAPLGLEFTPEYLEKDQYDFLFGCYMDGVLVGCCQLTPLESGVFQLRQMAVVPNRQGHNIGKELVAYVESYIQKEGGKKITLHARQEAQGFYEKIGYRVEGESFEEVGIPHFTMEKKLI